MPPSHYSGINPHSVYKAPFPSPLYSTSKLDRTLNLTSSVHENDFTECQPQTLQGTELAKEPVPKASLLVVRNHLRVE
jgi:hypothetical protein